MLRLCTVHGPPAAIEIMKKIRASSFGALAAASLVIFAGCAPHGAAVGERGYKIPPGHMPPPGQCRIWFPERPPGQQSPPGDCRELRHRVPHGAVLIRG
jgi:hypothetical protein